KGRLRFRRGSFLCLHTRLPFSESSAGPPITSLRPEGKAQRMSDAKPRTSLRSYWHTLPKKRADPVEDGSEVQQISVHLLTEPYVDVTAHTAPSQQTVSFSLEVMEVWINRHQTLVDRRFFFFSRS
ncbi:hypothetical protein ACJX0J_028307, partial [Zea mays]